MHMNLGRKLGVFTLDGKSEELASENRTDPKGGGARRACQAAMDPGNVVATILNFSTGPDWSHSLKISSAGQTVPFPGVCGWRDGRMENVPTLWLTEKRRGGGSHQHLPSGNDPS